MAKTSNAKSLVYLSEKDEKENGILDRSGLQRMKTSVQWFEDSRTVPQHNARYLKKLANLRTDLTDQEHDNIGQTVNRLLRDVTKSGEGGVVQNSIKKAAPTKESYPDRHKRLQQQRQAILEKRRKDSKKKVNIDPLKGEQLIETGKENDKKKENVQKSKASQSVDISVDIYDVIASQRSRLSQDKSVTNGSVSSKTTNNVQHQSSIPSLERKNAKQHKSLATLERSDRKRSDSFIRQMSLHQKDERGLYKTASVRRQLMRGDRDEIDLSPDAFKFDTPSDRRSSYASSNSSKQYSVPTSSPILWQNSSVKLPQLEGKREQTITPRGSIDNSGHDSSSTQTPRSPEIQNPQQVEYFSTTQPVHPSFLRTSTSVYAPTRRGYIRVVETENQRANRGQAMKRTHMRGPPDRNSKSFGTPLEDLQVQGSKSDRSRSDHNRTSYTTSGKTEAVRVLTENGEVIFVNQSDTALEFDLSPSPEMTLVNTPEDSPRMTPKNNPPQLGEKKVSLVVQMPDIVLNPPTPSRLVRSADDSVSLRKTFRQNELRQKEISNLLEDVKELSQIADELKRSQTNLAF